MSIIRIFAFLDRVILGKLLKNSRIGKSFHRKNPIDITYEKSQVYSLIMLRNQYTLKSTSTIKSNRKTKHK